MDHEEFKIVFGGIITLIAAIIALIGVVWKQRQEVREIHHQTNNNSGKSMKDHVDQSYQMNQTMTRKFDAFAREMLPLMMQFRDDTNTHNGKVDTQLEQIFNNIKYYHGEIK